MNPLTELAEYEELNRDLNRGKGPGSDQRVHGFPEGSSDVGGRGDIALEVSGNLRRLQSEGNLRGFPVLYRRSLAVSGQGPSFIMRISTAT